MQLGCEDLEKLVALLMPVGVIDPLEIVEVENADGKPLPLFAVSGVADAPQLGHQITAVGQLGQVVPLRELS